MDPSKRGLLIRSVRTISSEVRGRSVLGGPGGNCALRSDPRLQSRKSAPAGPKSSNPGKSGLESGLESVRAIWPRQKNSAPAVGQSSTRTLDSYENI